uniref:Uncharacterized protein n=1 Tax=Pseudonaja textilis TaxID=8673 RepID=A0A670YLI8_PSETE
MFQITVPTSLISQSLSYPSLFLWQPMGHGQIRSMVPPSHLGARGLSRQDTFDSEMPGSRDSAYTDPTDSCMDIETDPYEEPEPPFLSHRQGAWEAEEPEPHHFQGHGHRPPQCQGSLEAEEPDRQNHNRSLRGRGKGRERYCQEEEEEEMEALGHNQNNVEDWGRDAYIR